MVWGTEAIEDRLGLDFIDSLDRSSGSYEFDLIAAWRDPDTGVVYIGEDSGCSCPEPYEEVRSRADLIAVNSVLDFERAFSYEDIRGGRYSYQDYATAEQVRDFRAAVVRALTERG